METASISVLDSLPDVGRTQKFCEHWRHFMAARGDGRTWQTGDNTSNKQMDGNACGVFVLMNAEAIIKKTSTKVMRHCHVGYFRKYVIKRLLQDPSRANDAACDLPFCANTDRHLRRNQCDRCDKWAHPKCLGLHQDKTRSPCVFC
ncbi:uncharacterized protein LOC117339042 [Pecten maximus]|uniref:uncharacterized protein LOC117339042 n=1 Tax=Pecten maximus TaxID=6579 RepID=UPI00145802B9|nr:uncharacterized protein LOC117339042 [Pecten maximus]